MKKPRYIREVFVDAIITALMNHNSKLDAICTLTKVLTDEQIKALHYELVED